MKTKTFGLFAFPVFAAIMIGSAITPAFAENNAAAIIDEFGCSLLEADGGPGFTTTSMQVTTHGETTVLKCWFDDVPNDTGKAKVNSGFLCSTFEGLTTDTHSVVSKSGNAVLTCKINNAAQNP